MDEYTHLGKKDLILYLEDTKADSFQRWLSVLADKKNKWPKIYRLYRVADDKGFTIFWPPISWPGGEIKPGDVYTLVARFPKVIEVNEDGKLVGDQWNTDDVIYLQWLEVEKRLKVTISYEKLVYYLFPLFDLLESIGEDFPSSRKPIVDLVTELGLGYELNQDDYMGIIQRLSGENLYLAKEKEMILYFAELAIDASVDEVLDVLERDTKLIPDYEFGNHYRVRYSRERKSNTLRIYSMVFDKEKKEWLDVSPGNEVVRYEIFRNKEKRSTVKYFYDENQNHEKLCYLYLSRLGLAMGAEWGKNIKTRYEEIQAQIEKESGVHLGSSEWRTNEAGMKMRHYGYIPNDPESIQEAQENRQQKQMFGGTQANEKQGKSKRTYKGPLRERAFIWRDLSPWVKQLKIPPTPKACVEELKKKPAYRNKPISEKRMSKILEEAARGEYDDLLKNI